jgi:hypothetical protein
MAECFCGCGRKVRGFATRGMNKQGRRTVELVGKLRAARNMIEERGPLNERSDIGPILKSLDDKITEGEQFKAVWASFVHGGDLPHASVARQFKSDWFAWGKENMRFESFLSLPPEVQMEAARRARS